MQGSSSLSPYYHIHIFIKSKIAGHFLWYALLNLNITIIRDIFNTMSLVLILNSGTVRNLHSVQTVTHHRWIENLKFHRLNLGILQQCASRDFIKMADELQSKWELTRGYAALFTLLVTNSLGSASVQALKGAVPDFQLIAARCLLQVLTYPTLLKLSGGHFTVKQERIPAVLYNIFLYVTYNMGFYGSTVYLPLMEAFGIFSMVNVITAILHGKFMFNKDPNVPHLCAMGIMLVTILLIIQPSWLISDGNQPGMDPVMAMNTSRNVSVSQAALNMVNSWVAHDTVIGYSLAITAGIGYGFNLDVMSILLHDVPPLVKTFFVSAGGLVVSTMFSIYMEEICVSLSLVQCLLVMGHCCAACFSVYMLVYSAHILGSVRCSIGQSLQILVLMVFQYTLMQDIMPGHRNWIEVVGAILLIFGVSCASFLDLVQIYSGMCYHRINLHIAQIPLCDL